METTIASPMNADKRSTGRQRCFGGRLCRFAARIDPPRRIGCRQLISRSCGAQGCGDRQNSCPGAKPDDRSDGEREKARALYDWVSRNIRYVAVYLGSGGYVPHSADEVLANEYGDCKDHVVLLQALLAAAGIDSVPALINFGSSYTLPKVGSFASFNHVITYLPSLDLYVDSTAQFAPFGVLPFGDTDKPVVLTSLGRLGRTPRMRADANVTPTKVSMVIHPDGTIEGTSKATMTGEPLKYLPDLRGSVIGATRRTSCKGTPISVWRDRFRLHQPCRPEDIDRPYWIEGRFQLDPVANIPGRGAMRIPVGLAPGRFAAMAAERSVAISRHPWPCGSMTVSESYTIQFPSNVLITEFPMASYHDGQIEYRSTYHRVGRKSPPSGHSWYSALLRSAIHKDREHWLAFQLQLQRDLRSEIFTDR